MQNLPRNNDGYVPEGRTPAAFYRRAQVAPKVHRIFLDSSKAQKVTGTNEDEYT